MPLIAAIKNDKEWQVSSFALSKRLRELGFRQQSHWYWSFQKHEDGSEGAILTDYYLWKPALRPPRDFGEIKYYSAFTAAELGEMLPAFIEVGIRKGQKRMALVMGRTIGGEFRIDYRNETFCPPIISIAQSEADARAKMLIRLIENGVVKL